MVAARQILFAVFARYGDSVIAFKSIDRFIATYPGKEYIVVTTHQGLPYARALIQAPIRLYAINKRRNPIALVRFISMLRHRAPDVGFNPWSHGLESEWFVSYCTRFYYFRSYDASHRALNHYEKLRQYMLLPAPPRHEPWKWPRDPQRILIAPFSTDTERSLGREALENLVRELRALHPHAVLTLALMPAERDAVDIKMVDTVFVFRKSRARSAEFVALVKRADLFVGVDSGPLHLADAIGIPTVVFFGPTTPEKVLDRDSRAVPLELSTLSRPGLLRAAALAVSGGAVHH